MIDRLLVQRRLALIASYLDELSRLARVPRKAFLEDKDKTAAAESYLRRSLEAIFDIGRHVLAKSGGVELAMEYKSIARGLGDKGIVSKEMSDTLVKIAGYRNRMVHLYDMVDEEEIYDIIQANLSDIRSFIREVRDFLKKSSPGGAPASGQVP